MSEKLFNIHSQYKPAGDQPHAIKSLTKEIKQNFSPENKFNTLLGVTGSGKTYTVANVIHNTQKPTLIIAPNKTLSAQLYNEFKEFFPENSVEFFISYYDYYQPESYLPASDTFIEKTAKVNQEIDRLRHCATKAIFERQDTIIVASVSAIYGLGNPEDYYEASIAIAPGLPLGRDEFMQELINILFERNDFELKRGFFRCRGDVIDIFPAYEQELVRIEFFGDEIENISLINPVTGQKVKEITETFRIYPAKHYVTNSDTLEAAIKQIKKELDQRLKELEYLGKDIEAARLRQRTLYDIEMMRETGYCNGVENYSRILEGRKPGTCPQTLIDYFNRRYGDDWLCVLDESHISTPQIRGMHNGDANRKQTLIDYGFRLPCARDNRPLKFNEFLEKTKQILFVSATPADYEQEVSSNIIKQIVRPTGLIDPVIHVKPSTSQIEDLLDEIHTRVEKQQRVLITTLTKKSAEDLSDYLAEKKVKAQWLHSELKALERVEILKDLREGHIDVLIGVNLLREGLDLPEVSLVAILDADKEGFLRSKSALIQTIGRAARNDCGEVILYADKITTAMQAVIEFTEDNRTRQLAHNKKYNITPKTIQKKLENSLLDSLKNSSKNTTQLIADELINRQLTTEELPIVIRELEEKMLEHAQDLNFERASQIRDQIKQLKREL